METIKQVHPMARMATKKTSAEPVYLLRLFNRQAENFEKTRFGWMAMLITIQSCLGSVACMYILQGKASVVVLALCAAVTMGSNAIFIAQANAKTCLIGFYISLVLNSVFLLQNL